MTSVMSSRLSEPLDQLEAGFGFLDRLEIEVLGDDRTDSQSSTCPASCPFHREGRVRPDGRSAEVMTYSSFSKRSSFLGTLPRARARSAATLGFSAMTSALGIVYWIFTKRLPGSCLTSFLHFKGEQRRRDLGGWQPAFGDDLVNGSFVVSDGIAHHLLGGTVRFGTGAGLVSSGFSEKAAPYRRGCPARSGPAWRLVGSGGSSRWPWVDRCGPGTA